MRVLWTGSDHPGTNTIVRSSSIVSLMSFCLQLKVPWLMLRGWPMRITVSTSE
jgi:hypothetical protein